MTNELLPPSISADDWAATPAVVQALVLELLKTIKHLEAQEAETATIRAQLLDLKAQMNQNSRNSSRPPSSDPPNTPPEPPRTPRGKPRSRGGQPGHEGQTRDLVPPDRVNEFVLEQALRPAVLWRKGSFGTQSDAGSRFVERILTVRETCRRQGKPLRQFVTDAVEACRRGEPAPRLLAATP